MADQRYRVIERLEAGGMAEVFIGEVQAVEGFKKRVAIKRVLPHLAQNKNFMGMFLDEARLSARLDHANIVSVFDIGAADNTYFLVMEYVDGINLKSMMEVLRKQNRTFPLKESLYVVMESLRGLSYAHELTDDEGNHLGLVHRDMSPPNILLSKRGEVKVTDFGLAKATTQLEKTDPGVVKGKFSYLSPEGAMGERVDHRADLFSVGIVLWEMLAGRRLFLGETDYQTVKLVQQANVPSLRQLNSQVDEELEGVLMRALTRDPNARYQSAQEFDDALADYLFSHQLKVTSHDIAKLVQHTLSHKSQEAQPQAQQDQSIIDRLIQEELLRFTSLDEMSDPLSPGAQPLSSEEVDGSQPLDASSFGGFENPAEWFAEDAGSAEAGAAAASQERSAPGWHEAGLDPELQSQDQDSVELARLLEDDTGQVAVPAGVQEDEGTPPPEPGPDAATYVGPGNPTASEPARGGSAWKVILVTIVLLAGAGAAAWFGGVIPH